MPIGILRRSKLTPTREALNLPAESLLDGGSKFAFWTWTALGYVLPSNGHVLEKHQELGFVEFEAIWVVEGETGLHVSREKACLLYTSPSPRDQRGSRMPSSA